MIAEDDDQGLLVGELERLAHDLVSPPVLILDDPRILGPGRPAAIGRVIGLTVAPEQVLNPIGRVEQAVEEAFLEPLQLVEHHGLAFPPGQVALVEERVLADPLVVDPGVVLDHPRGVDRCRWSRPAGRHSPPGG